VIKQIPLYSEMHRFILPWPPSRPPGLPRSRPGTTPAVSAKSKYGLSRVYKVLLDLLVIKTLASFAARPLLWFGLLAMPILFFGTALIGYELLESALLSQPLSLPIAGCGIIFIAAAFMLVFAGALGELIYNLGDMRDHEFARLTQHLHVARVETELND